MPASETLWTDPEGPSPVYETIRNNLRPANNLVVAVDPGKTNTGIAVAWPEGDVTCTTHEPWDAVREVVELLACDDLLPGRVEAVVLEQWVPYPGVGNNTYRDLVEAKINGAIEWECRKRDVPVFYQLAHLLTPTEALANSRGYTWAAEDRDQKAAETHLYYYLNLKDEAL